MFLDLSFSTSDSFKPLQIAGVFLLVVSLDVGMLERDQPASARKAKTNQSPDFSDGTSSGCQCGVSTPSYFSMVHIPESAWYGIWQ